MTTFLTILICTIFCHIIDDFVLQSIGCLAMLKQKSYWKESCNEKEYPFYKYDYVIALLVHGFSWSFMIHLPLMIYAKFKLPIELFISLFIQAIAHSYMDNEKANKKSVNLIMDQIYHFIQIITSVSLLHIFK